MSASISGIFTLLALIFCGPLFFALRNVYRKRKEGLLTREVQNFEQQSPLSSSSSFLKEEEDRHEYSSNHYLFALIGYAIGVGNIWRFPYVMAQNGGAVALLAYLICAVLVATPLFLYEMIVGQHVRLSTIRCYQVIRPRWLSLGIASGCMLFIVLSYYGMVVAYTFLYLWNSLKNPLPWIEQGAESFWFHSILNTYPDWNGNSHVGVGPIQWPLALSLIIFWGIVYGSIGFGKKILAKVTYVTVLLPVFLLLILVLRTVWLEGASDGIQFYMGRLDWSQFTNIRVWAAACGQIIFSLSPGFGTAITYSSFAKPNEDVYRACMIVAVSNIAFSIMGGLAIFSLLGHLAMKDGVPVEDLAKQSGMGLAFITMAEAMQYFGPAANVMSVLFFFMLFLLGLDSAYAMLETLVAYVEDFLRGQQQKQPEQEQQASEGRSTHPIVPINLVCTIVLAMVGLLFTTRLGSQLLDLMDHYVGGIFLLCVALVESIMLNVDFGWKRLAYALTKATYGNPATPKGRTLFPYWLCRLDFHLTVPAFTGLLGCYWIYSDIQTPYGGYPASFLKWGWILLGCLLALIPCTLWKQDSGTLPDFMEDEIHEDDPLEMGPTCGYNLESYVDTNGLEIEATEPSVKLNSPNNINNDEGTRRVSLSGCV